MIQNKLSTPSGGTGHAPIRKRLRILLVTAQLLITPLLTFAQTAPTAPVMTPVYDAVSIKLNKSGHDGLNIDSNTYRYSATNISVRDLLEEAYGIRKDLIAGVDGPVASAHFDIEAKIVDPDPVAVANMTQVQRRSMILRLLQERFRLVAHTVSRTLPIYDLELTKDGPKFKESTNVDQKDKGTRIHNQEMDGKSITMVELADTFTNQVQRTVIDKTGLTARYDLKLKWSRDTGAPLDDGNKDVPPLIYTALQEQLGLKLKSDKGPVETLVVDHVEMPSEN